MITSCASLHIPTEDRNPFSMMRLCKQVRRSRALDPVALPPSSCSWSRRSSRIRRVRARDEPADVARLRPDVARDVNDHRRVEGEELASESTATVVSQAPGETKDPESSPRGKKGLPRPAAMVRERRSAKGRSLTCERKRSSHPLRGGSMMIVVWSAGKSMS